MVCIASVASSFSAAAICVGDLFLLVRFVFDLRNVLSGDEPHVSPCRFASHHACNMRTESAQGRSGGCFPKSCESCASASVQYLLHLVDQHVVQ